MNATRLLPILVSVLGISCGQLLLKLAAVHSANESGQPLSLLNGYMLAGVLVLGLSTLLWTWILRGIPLSTAYPFMALAFVLVPMLGYVLLGESLSPRQLVGTALIVLGVWVVAG